MPRWPDLARPDGNEPITRDVGTLTRPIADLYPEQVGLSIEERQQLLRSSRWKSSQLRHVGTNRAVDRAPCQCRHRPDDPRQDFPLGELATPESWGRDTEPLVTNVDD